MVERSSTTKYWHPAIKLKDDYNLDIHYHEILSFTFLLTLILMLIMHWRNHKLYQILFKHLILNHNHLILRYSITTINCQSFSQELCQWSIHYAKCNWRMFTVVKIYLLQNISELGSTSVIVSTELEWNFNSAVLVLILFLLLQTSCLIPANYA